MARALLMTELPKSIAQLTTPIQLLTLVAALAILALASIARTVTKSPDPARRWILAVIVAGVIGLPIGLYVLVITDKHAPTETVERQAQAIPNSASTIVKKRPDSVFAEQTVSIPGVAPSHISATAGTTRNTSLGHTDEVSPSFPCANAKEDDEKIICATPELRRADGALGKVYRAALAALPITERTSLIHSERAWLVDRHNRCGGSVECLQNSVQLRAAELAQMAH